MSRDVCWKTLSANEPGAGGQVGPGDALPASGDTAGAISSSATDTLTPVVIPPIIMPDRAMVGAR